MLRYKAPSKLYNNFLNYCILCQNLQESHDNNKIIFVTIIKDPLKNFTRYNNPSCIFINLEFVLLNEFE